MNEQWKQLLEESRNNYLSIVQALSRMQKEFEKLMMNSAENGISYQQEMGNILNNWVEMGNSLRENFKEIFEANLKSTFSSLSLNMPFKDELDRLYQNIQESFQKYFDNLDHFNVMGKK